MHMKKNIGASVVYLNAVDNESTFPRNEHSYLLQKSTTVDAVSDSTANSTTSMSWCSWDAEIPAADFCITANKA